MQERPYRVNGQHGFGFIEQRIRVRQGLLVPNWVQRINDLPCHGESARSFFVHVDP
jgi:hypothetical protein